MWWFSSRNLEQVSGSRANKSRRQEGLSRRGRRTAIEQLESRRVLAAVPVPTSLLIYTPPQTTVAGQLSGLIKVEILDQNGHAIAAPAGGEVVDLTSTSGKGTFLNLQGTASLPPAIAPALGQELTITAGTSAAAFRYTDQTAGAPTITVTWDPHNGLQLKPASNKTTQQDPILAAAASHAIFVNPATLAPLPSQNVAVGAANAVELQLLDKFNNVATAASNTVVVQGSSGGSRTTVLGGQQIALSSSPSGQFFSDSALTKQISQIVVPIGSSLSPQFYFTDTASVPFDTASASAANLAPKATQQEILNSNFPSQVVFGTSNSPFTAGVAASVNGMFEDVHNLAASTIVAGSPGGTLTITGGTTTGVFTNFTFDNTTGVTINGSSNLTGPFSGTITIAAPAGTDFGKFSFKYTDTIAGPVTFNAAATFGLTTLKTGTQSDVVVANPDLSKAQLLFSPTSATAEVGSPSGQFTLELEDQFGNPLNDSPVAVTTKLTSSSPTGTFQAAGGANLPGSQITIAADSATSAPFTYTDTTSSMGSVFTIKATSTTVPPIVATATVAVQAPPTQIVLSANTLGTLTAGQKSGQVTVTLEDANGNVVNAIHNTTITLTSTNTVTGKFQNVTSPNANVTTLSILAGSDSATFTYTDTLASTPTLTVKDTTDGFASQTVSATITAGAAAKLSFTTLTGGSVTVGTVVPVSFVYLDKFNNIATPPAGITVTATASGGSVSNLNAATGTFNFQSATAGTFTIALSSKNPTLTATASPFTITVRLPNGVNPPAFVHPEFDTPLYTTITTPNGVPGWTWNGVGQAGTTDAPITNPSPDFPFSNWAFMTGGAAFSQTLNFTSIGVYTLTFFAEELSPGADLTVLLDNSTTTVSPAVTPAAAISAAAPTQITVTMNINTVGNHTITFLSGQPNQNTTGTVLISVVAFE